MPLTAISGRTPVRLALSDCGEEPGQPGPWIGPLLALGTRAARYISGGRQRQLVVALSVPQRDFAAALVGCGWVMASRAPVVAEPLETLRSLEPGTPVRVVTEHHVFTGLFWSLNEAVSPARAQFGGSKWHVDSIRALAVLPELNSATRMCRPEVGGVGRMARLDQEWAARLVAPAADLAIVGTLAWLEEDFGACIGREGDGLPPAPIRDLLLPYADRVPTWFTRVYAAARFAEQLPIAPDIRAVILDGAGAIKYLTEIEAPVAICILDRSVADETAAEIVVQLRNTRGEPLSIQRDLGWPPPAGIEALAFTVAL